MKRYYDKAGNPTPWISEHTSKNSLEKMSVEHLILFAKEVKGIKKLLVNFIFENKDKL